MPVFITPTVNIRGFALHMERYVPATQIPFSIRPKKFIPVAEEGDLIDVLGSFVLRRACEQTVVLRKDGFPALELGVNLSAKQLENPDLLNDFETILRETEMAPELLCLELTETALMQHADRWPTSRSRPGYVAV